MLWPLARMNYNCITKSWFMALDCHNLLWSQHFKTHITGRIWLPYYSDQSFVQNKLLFPPAAAVDNLCPQQTVVAPHFN